MKHQRLVNALALTWMICATRVAVAASYAADIKSYDYESLLWALAAALLGGAARTILTLASDKIVVLDLMREARKDAIVAMIGGGICYLIVQFGMTVMPQFINSEFRMLALLATGFSKGKWQIKLGTLVDDGFANLRNKVRGEAGPPPEDHPASANMPLDPK